ncbi:sensor histidine kinase [Polluticaenibacter yanchengensis]|uniref:histidine kinase n=1 Tax=Polluticaenibacter yanchengensis TaxID=3014562 RepID=A0ABT4UP63_9BACT|nr:hypothetical protein [Chitinophagaceae bacterium LY-5]
MQPKFVIKIAIIIAIITGSPEKVSAQLPQDSAGKVIKAITIGYQNGKIDEKTYLDSVFTTMRLITAANIGYSNKELLNMLKDYRAVIWKTKNNFKYKRDYYGILSNHAQSAARYGEMVYYGEKIDQLEREQNKKPSLTALAIILDYYLSHQSYEKMAGLYRENIPYLRSLPDTAATGAMKGGELVQAIIVLEKSARALYEIKDTTEGDKIKVLQNKIIAIIRTKYANNNNIRANADFLQLNTAYAGAIAKNDIHALQLILANIDTLLVSTTTPEYLKYYIDEVVSEWKIKYFQKTKKNDSVSYYINKYETLIKDEAIPYNHYLLKRSQAEFLFNKMSYREAYDTLKTGTDILETSRTELVKDIDDMLYARAKTEEQEIQLKEAELKSKRTENIILYTVIGSVLAISSILFLLWYSRQKQKRQFLEFKLNMARNIHDEAGPALLYAKSLAKATRTSNDEILKLELEKHLDTTMSTIRGLSHDLKSTELHSLSSLIKMTDQTLKKLKRVNGFNYKIEDKSGSDRFISHYQFSQLKAIIQECIVNSIKHSEFDKIHVNFMRDNNKLMIIYKDNGKGWVMGNDTDGIGMKNMEERSHQLNGELSVNSEYPNGYNITLSVLLR